MSDAPRERFAELVARPDAEIDLAEAALWVAAEHCEGLDVPHYLARLDELAQRVGRRMGSCPTAQRIARLNQQLFGEEGFRGNQERYDDPRNSFLNDVLDRRTGIPITLSLVYQQVANRLGLDVRGVGFPGHFLVKCLEGGGPDGGETIVDPFHGTVLDRAGCLERLRAALGAEAHLRPEVHLRDARPGEVLVRLLTNLKILYARQGRFECALACCDRILLVAPDIPSELRDRGLVYEQLECFRAAAADLERFLALAPDDATAGSVRERLSDIRLKATPLH